MTLLLKLQIKFLSINKPTDSKMNVSALLFSMWGEKNLIMSSLAVE